MQPIRTASEISVHIKILPAQHLPLYQKIAQKATELHLLGMSYEQIAKSLKEERSDEAIPKGGNLCPIYSAFQISSAQNKDMYGSKSAYYAKPIRLY